MNSLVVVSGATGNQGSGVVDACLKAGFKVRAITRNVEGDAAKALAAKGVEVVRADFDDPTSLKEAYRGAQCAFIMTDFMKGAMCNPEREAQQAINQADAAVEMGCAHLVYSSQPDATEALKSDMTLVGGKWKVPIVESKMKAEAHMRKQGYPATYLPSSCFMELLFTMFYPQPKGDGTFAVRLPGVDGKKLPWICKEDFGSAVAACFKEGPGATAGRAVQLCADAVAFEEVPALLSKVTGRTVAYEAQTDEEHKGTLEAMGLPADVAQGFVNTFLMQRRYNGHDLSGVDLKARVPEALTLEQWMQAHKDQLLALMDTPLMEP